MQLYRLTATSLLFVTSLIAGATLSVGNGSAAPGRTVSLPVSLSSAGTQVAAIQWQLNYSTQDFSNISVSLGSSGSSAAKSVQCASSSAGQYSCMLSGPNQNVIGDGTVATVTMTVSNSATNSSSPVSLTALGSAPESWFLSVGATGGLVTIPQSTSLSGLTCAPATMASAGSASCTVSLTASAPSGGSVVSLGQGGAGVTLSMPSSVTVPAGATQATFTIQAPAISTNSTVTLFATLNGVTKNFAVTIVPKSLSSLSITPANATIVNGATQQFTAKGTYSDGSTADLTTTVTWSSSNTAVATISSAGLATGVGAGQTTVKAASGSINGSTPLTVVISTFTLGNTTTGTTAGSNDANHISASRFTMPQGRSGAVTSLSVYVAAPVSASPRNLFQVAIYSDNGGKPGTLLASSSSQALTPNSWNTANLSVALQAGVNYWLAYNTNATDKTSNNMRLTPGGSTVSISQTFGSWPAKITKIPHTSNQSGSIYATVQ